MKNLYVKNLKDYMGKEVEGEFYISRKEVRKKKDGGPYIELALADVTGSAPAVVFEDVETLDGVIREGSVFLIRGNVGSFNDSLQVKVVWARAVTEYDPRDYVKSTEKDIGLMEEKLLSIVDSVLDPYLKKLLDQFFRDEKFMRKFKLAPAAKKLHHAFIGGLLEHTLSVTELARVVASRYREVNTDLLISGALLHDVGKTEEYGFFPMIELTDRGRLLGHLVIGYEMVSAKIEELRDYLGGFPEDTKMKILHMILSHHGELSWGSPVVPQTVEAQILHFLDNLDAKVWMFLEARGLTKDPMARWSEYHRGLSRFVFLGGGEEDSGELFP